MKLYKTKVSGIYYSKTKTGVTYYYNFKDIVTKISRRKKIFSKEKHLDEYVDMCVYYIQRNYNKKNNSLIIDGSFVLELFNNSNIPIAIIEQKTNKCIECNDSFIKLLLLDSRDEIIGKNLFKKAPSLFHIYKNNHKNNYDELYKILLEKGSFESEIELLLKNGSKVWIKVIYMIIKREGHIYLSIVINIIDSIKKMQKNLLNTEYKIKEQLYSFNNTLEQKIKQKIKDLNKANSKLKEAYKVAKLAHWTSCIKYDNASWSNEFYNILERDQNKGTIGAESYINTYVHPQDKKLIYKIIEKSLQSQNITETTHRIITDNGNIKWLYSKFKPRFNEDGNPFEIFGIVQDITKEKIYEKKLQDKNNYINSLRNISNKNRFRDKTNSINSLRNSSNEIKIIIDQNKIIKNFSNDANNIFYNLQNNITLTEFLEREDKNEVKLLLEFLSSEYTNKNHIVVYLQNRYFKVVYKYLSDYNSIINLHDITDLKKQEKCIK
jgi:PAS domain-containing protein